jgi:predicted XRE-type DNA-binding protein
MASEKFSSAFDAIADTPEEAANLRARAELIQAIGRVIRRHEWTQAEAGKRAGITQPRVHELMKGRISKFSLDALVQIATALGLRVHLKVEELDVA